MSNPIPEMNHLNGSTPVKLFDKSYLMDIVNGNANIAKEIIDLFLQQVPAELSRIHTAALTIDYPNLKMVAHTMQSSLSVLGITGPMALLKKIEELAGKSTGIENIILLDDELQLKGSQVLAEVALERSYYE